MLMLQKIQLSVLLIFTLANIVLATAEKPPEADFEKIVFVKRYTYTANH